MKNAKEIIEKYTVDGNTDWEKVDAAINDHINGIVVKQTEKAKETAAEQVRTDIFKGLDIEGVEDEKALKSRIKELSDGTAAFKKQIEEAQSKYGELEKQYANVTKTTDTLTKEKKLLELGLLDEDERELVMVAVNRRIGDDKDFDTALAEVKEEKPHYFAPKNPSTTGSRARGQTPDNKPGWFTKLAERNPELKDE